MAEPAARPTTRCQGPDTVAIPGAAAHPPGAGAGRYRLTRISPITEGLLSDMVSPAYLVSALATAGVVAAIALTPTASSNAYDAHAGPQKADIGARHAHPIR